MVEKASGDLGGSPGVSPVPACRLRIASQAEDPDEAGPGSGLISGPGPGDQSGPSETLELLRILPRSVSPYETDLFVRGIHLIISVCPTADHCHDVGCEAIPCPAGMVVCVRIG